MVRVWVASHLHVLPETHHTQNTCTDKATNFSLLVVNPWSSPHHTSLTHVGPDLAGHASTNESYAILSQEQNVMDIRKYLGKRTRRNSQINLVVKSPIQRNHSVVQTGARHS